MQRIFKRFYYLQKFLSPIKYTIFKVNLRIFQPTEKTYKNEIKKIDTILQRFPLIISKAKTSPILTLNEKSVVSYILFLGSVYLTRLPHIKYIRLGSVRPSHPPHKMHQVSYVLLSLPILTTCRVNSNTLIFQSIKIKRWAHRYIDCLLYTSPSPRD